MQDAWKYWAVGAALVVWLMAAWFLGTLLGLHNVNLWILRGGLALVGIIAAVGFVFWSRAKKGGKEAAAAIKAGAAPAKGELDEIDLFVRQAEQKLKSSALVRGATIANLPAIILLGEAGAGKSTVIVKSGLEPEVLAGQATAPDTGVPATGSNLWFARQTIFVEAGAQVAGEAPLWARLVRRLAPAKLSSVVGKGTQAPRAVVVCVDCETFAKPNAAETLAATARNIRARLAEMSQLLGISFPVYVLFAKADRIRFFEDYARTLTNPEAAEVLGVTLPIVAESNSGIYAEQESKRLAAAFGDLYLSLGGKRTEFLPREYDGSRWPGIYEFPREFHKLQTAVVQLLVELCRPSQLRVTPFLRGFYFVGRRMVSVESAISPQTQKQPALEGLEEVGGATRVFDLKGMDRSAPAAPSIEETLAGATRVFDARKPLPEGTLIAGPRLSGFSPPPPPQRQEPQWVFLTHLFGDVLLQDRTALAASGSSSKVGLWQRLLLAAACVLGLIFAVGFLVSYLANRNMETTVADAARGAVVSPANLLPSLQRLDQLRGVLETVGDYNMNGPPLHLRWGLYAGREVYPVACRVYAQGFRKMLLDSTQASLLGKLKDLPASPKPDDEFAPTYDTLRAYLITTTNPEQSRRDFLSPLLFQNWSAGRELTSDEAQLSQAQFDFYSRALEHHGQLGGADCFASDADANAVNHARAYLNQFPPEERVYRAMLADASKGNPNISFPHAFPNAAGIVVDAQEVSGAYSKGGWDAMARELKNPQPYIKGEPWVLGPQAGGPVDVYGLQQKLGERYQKEFIGAWRSFLAAARVVPYRDPLDASRKLDALSGNQSPLLELFYLVSQNVSGNSDLAKAFQPAVAVVPASEPGVFVGKTNKSYLGALLDLKGAFDQARQAPAQAALAPGAASPISQSAGQARLVTAQIAQNFTPDPTWQIDNLVKNLMLAPIVDAEAAQPKPGAALNVAGRTFCGQVEALYRRYPFNPSASQASAATLKDFDAIFQPTAGALAQLYAQGLSSALVLAGSQYVMNSASPVKLNPAFVDFFNRAMAMQQALYPNGSAEPQVRFTLTPTASEGVKTFALIIDGQVLNYPGPAKQIVWSGSANHMVAQSVAGMGSIQFAGLWGLFEYFAQATWRPAGNTYALSWVQKSGNQPYIINGKPVTIGVQLDMMGAPPVFKPNYFGSSLRCVPKVAQ